MTSDHIGDGTEINGVPAICIAVVRGGEWRGFALWLAADGTIWECAPDAWRCDQQCRIALPIPPSFRDPATSPASRGPYHRFAALARAAAVEAGYNGPCA